MHLRRTDQSYGNYETQRPILSRSSFCASRTRVYTDGETADRRQYVIFNFLLGNTLLPA